MFTNSLIEWLGFVGGDLLGGLSAEGLMRPIVVVVDEVIEKFVGKVVEVVEGGAVDDILVQGAPEALDMPLVCGR